MSIPRKNANDRLDKIIAVRVTSDFHERVRSSMDSEEIRETIESALKTALAERDSLRDVEKSSLQKFDNRIKDLWDT